LKDIGICETFDKNEVFGYSLLELMTVLITVVNVIIQVISVVMIEHIGFHTITEVTAAIMSTVTFATFFNTAILLLITSANTEYSILWWLPFRGMYTDLDQNWYISIGDTLVYTMLINSFNIYISFFTSLATKIVMRQLDKGWKHLLNPLSVKHTKCLTIPQYVELWSGPMHVMYTPYAICLNTIYTTLMYGIPLPVLYPIACLTFANVYIVERMCVCYWY